MTDPITKTEREAIATKGTCASPHFTDDAKSFIWAMGKLHAYEAALRAAEARIAEMEKALEPFAKHAVFECPTIKYLDDDDQVVVSIGDCRRARAALSTTGDTGHD